MVIETEQAFYGAVRGDGGDREIVRKLVRTSGRDPGYIAMCRRDATWLVDVHRDRIAPSPWRCRRSTGHRSVTRE
jgi:hypothetical protein